MTESGRARDEAVIQFMITDFLAEILKYSASPGEMGQYLARQLREFMGVRTVVMLQQEGGARIVAIEPGSASTEAMVPRLEQVLALMPGAAGSALTSTETAAPELRAALAALKVDSLSMTPLRVGDLRVGTLFGLGHLDIQRPDELSRLLDALSPVFALILRNTLHFESQEMMVLTQAENYQALLRTNLDGFVVVGPQGAILDANEAYAHMTGYSVDELRTRDVLSLEALESHAAYLRRTENLKTHGSDRFLSRHRRKDGTTFPVEVSVTYVPNQDLIIGFIRDLTDRVRAEAALRESEAHHRELLEMLGEGISIVDPGEIFVMANREMDRIFGVGPGGLVGRNLREFLDEPDLAWVLDQTRLRRKGATGSYEVRIRRPDGQVRTLHNTVTPRFDSAGTFTGSLSVVRDLTDQLRTQEALRLAQKMQSLGSLAGGVAHDMNNVLGAILALASVHHLQAEDGSPLQAHMETIVKACQRGGTLVKGLLGFARQDLAEKREVDLNAVVREQVALLERTTLQKVDLAVDLAPDLPRILGDPAALNHALMNLCVNAVDAMPGGGTLALRTWREAGKARLEVADTGSGMPEEVLRKALDPFFSTKPQGKGTGLGLSMAYSTVTAHRGELEIQSRVGQGTRILLAFPACAEPAPGPGADGGRQAPPLARRLEVLLIDDDELIQEAVRALLKALGCTVAVASGGEQALAALEAGLDPGLVILDMNMPGLDGAATLPHLRALRPDVPIILATGRVDQSVLALVDADPRLSLLAKPFSLEELQARLEELAGQGALGD
ncbi:PAS domain-containing sensor histidine kinase [Geothrix sp. 21YS21S-2]|uniref:hybrid sensor histidine kinase/response regulator n=1 Tax=Geothrix sp. 21YS21S-2 TaxID=3068893 RepID=UPI0027B94A18|nr:PAS domain-containing sensor histidine kinase [Geothrix sp. 21YS21S-2]